MDTHGPDTHSPHTDPGAAVDAIRCSDKEMPFPLAAAADAHFIGAAAVRSSAPMANFVTGGPMGPGPVEAHGGLSVALFGGQLAGILVPVDPLAPALWLILPLAGVGVAATGSQGLLRQRPETVTLATDDTRITLRDVVRLWPVRRALQPRQEGELVKELHHQQRRGGGRGR